MREVEIKARIDGSRAGDIHRWLFDTGFIYLDREYQCDEYYDHPCRNFSETDEALRIRYTTAEDGEGETLLTYKGANLYDLGQTREELECVVDDVETMRLMLQRLDFFLKAIVIKTRETYIKGDIKISLDKVRGAGDYVELEIICDDDSANENRQRLMDILDELDFTSPVIEQSTYLDLILNCSND